MVGCRSQCLPGYPGLVLSQCLIDWLSHEQVTEGTGISVKQSMFEPQPLLNPPLMAIIP